MAQYKLFSKSLAAKDIEKLGDEFSLTYYTYLVSIIFPKDQVCMLSTLQFCTPGTSWQIAASNVVSNNQEITVEVGVFSPELSLDLTWIIEAITNISNIAVFLVNKQTGRFVKLAPVPGPKTIDKGKRWVDEKLNVSLSSLNP